MPRAWYRNDSAYWAILAVVGLLFSLLMCADSLDVYRSGANDFVVFYGGAKLVGTPGLYDREANYAVARGIFGEAIPSWRYIRLPFHAALLWPLGRMEYSTAYAIWCALSLGALAGFAWLWRMPSRWVAVFAVAWSLPAFASLVSGQDCVFMLLLIALAVRFERDGRDGAAGVALALCAIKVHLILLIPLWLIAQRRWKTLQGFAWTGLLLAAVSFAVAGWHWPWEFASAALDAQVHPRVGSLPNLHGLFDGLPGAPWLEGLATLGVIAAAWRFIRGCDFAGGLAVSLVGGFLIGRHGYALDTVILVPAILTIAKQAPNVRINGLAVFLLSPVFYLSVSLPHPFSYAGQVALLALFVGAVGNRHPIAAEKDEDAGRPEIPRPMKAVAVPAFARNLQPDGQPGKIK
jgi:hypothetical protein